MTPDQKRRYKVQMINLAGCILSEPTVYSQHQTHSLIPKECTEYRQTTDKRNHSNSSAKTSNLTTSLNLQSAKHQHENTNLHSQASFKIQNKPNTISNQQRTYALTSKGYYNTDIRPNSASSDISSSSGTSINMPLVQCQQDNKNFDSVVFTNIPPSVQHQTQPFVQQCIENVRYTYPYYN